MIDATVLDRIGNRMPVGGSSGTSVATLRAAENVVRGPVVVILADSWDRYFLTA